MITLNDIRHLLDEIERPVLSLYLNVNPRERDNQATTPAWRIWLKNALRDLEDSLDKDQKPLWENIQKRLDLYLQAYQPKSKSLALFLSANEEREYALPVPLVNRAAFGEPLVGPLLWAIDEYEPYLIVLVDQEKAHFLTAYLGSASEQETAKLELDTSDWREKTLMPPSAPAGVGSGSGSQVTHGSARDVFERRVDTHVERFHQSVADHIADLVEKHKITRIILGGDEQAAHAVHNLMPDTTARKVISVMPVPLRYSPHQVLEHVLPTALEHERQYEKKLLDEIINLAKSGGRGAVGREDVLNALEQKRVELLVAPWPMSDEDLLTRLPLKALASGSELELVHGEAAERLQAVGGLAARLYYS